MNKKQIKKIEYRKKIIKSISLETILEELVRRGLNPSISSEGGIVKTSG